MKMMEINASQYSVSTWSGGETIEYYLSPAQGIYEVGKFAFRVSSATIELSESTFSLLPGYKRLIMSLDQPLTLRHGGLSGEEIKLVPFETHYFLGEEPTQSIGKCIDFNLIYQESLLGELVAYYQGEQLMILPKQTCVIVALEELCIQCYQGERLLRQCQLKAKNSLVVEELTGSCQFVLTTKSSTTKKPIAIVARIVER